VENESIETSPDNNSSNRDSGKFHVVGRSVPLGRLVNAIKFLMFREDIPKHHVIQNIPLIIALCASVVPATWILSGLLFTALQYYGMLGFLLGYVAITLALIEVPHCILDR